LRRTKNGVCILTPRTTTGVKTMYHVTLDGCFNILVTNNLKEAIATAKQYKRGGVVTAFGEYIFRTNQTTNKKD
jgi:hypothetical protein